MLQRLHQWTVALKFSAMQPAPTGAARQPKPEIAGVKVPNTRVQSGGTCWYPDVGPSPRRICRAGKPFLPTGAS